MSSCNRDLDTRNRVFVTAQHYSYFNKSLASNAYIREKNKSSVVSDVILRRIALCAVRKTSRHKPRSHPNAKT